MKAKFIENGFFTQAPHLRVGDIFIKKLYLRAGQAPTDFKFECIGFDDDNCAILREVVQEKGGTFETQKT